MREIPGRDRLGRPAATYRRRPRRGCRNSPLPKSEPASTAPDAASGLLRLMKEAPVLVVLDNLETLPPDEHQVLARFLKKVPRNGSRVLVTARSELKDFDDVPGTRSRTLTTGLDEYSGAHHAIPLRPPQGRESPAR